MKCAGGCLPYVHVTMIRRPVTSTYINVSFLYFQSCETCTGSSSGGMSEQDGLEIPVWLGGCEKWVTGLTKRTTCDDIIYALLCHDNNPNEGIDVQNYAVYERWRDMERPLRGRTKILKVWRAWGTECHNVRFYMRKVENVLDESCEVSSIKSFTRKPRRQSSNHDERRSRGRDTEGRSRQKSRDQHNNHRNSTHTNNHNNTNSNTSHRIHRSYREPHHRGNSRDTGGRDDSLPSRHPSDKDTGYRDSFRHSHRDSGYHSSHRDSSLPPNRDSGHRRSADKRPRSQSQDRHTSEHSRVKEEDPNETQTKPSPSEEVHKSQAFHQLVQIIIDQEKKLQDLLVRTQDTDKQIESHETKIHMLRMQKNGQNYVQEAYLRDKSDESSASSEELFPHVKSVDLDAYIHICENILEIQDRITGQEGKIDDLSETIMEESLSQSPQPQTPRRRRRPPIQPEGEVNVQERIEDLTHEIERCQRINTTQQEQFDSLDGSLKECDTQMQLKMDYMCKLQCEIDLVQVEDNEYTVNVTNGNNKENRHNTKENSHPVVQFLEDHLEMVTAKLDSPVVNGNSVSKPRGILKDTQSKYGSIPPEQTDVLYKLPLTNSKGKTMIPYCTYTTYQDSYQSSSPTGLKHNVSDDSDTGLSSLHSDDPPPLLETLV